MGEIVNNVAGAGVAPTLGAFRAARKGAVLVVGLTVLAFGVVLIVLPGPAFLVIPAGLAILATEFLWARRLLQNVKDRAARLLARARAQKPRALPHGKEAGDHRAGSRRPVPLHLG